MKVQILGSGCKKCNTLTAETIKAAKNLGVDIDLEKVTDYGEISSFGVMSTPALVIDGDVKFSGEVKKAKKIEEYIKLAMDII
ncbi:thioredoxin family protein [Thiospirochaeta perfilievii]|uniref:Thioredoxin family protein n=1 Tax=Thiospirochaeta perfilievii TaxID=252967 RepID=A0A5C1Q9K9_9SPIO|nr:thioredoxin family protein [Thiospirochaeta perfilievii]QEN03476.1 thioredoxin family protein [Thiospirochaeta perfilievii]